MLANTRLSRSKGFTLVEILIVVVILGILAAIVIPQFTNASETAKGSSLVSQLQTIRSQLELFQVQHNGHYPDLSTSWNIMTQKSLVSEYGPGDPTNDATCKYGPYLQQAPKNPFTDSFSVAAAGAGTATDGWEYTAATGSIIAVGFDEAARTYTAPSGP